MNQIILSIILPVYNGEKFIKKTIDKLLKIDLKKEIIVINDCSIDNTQKILESYNDKIELINLNKNCGVSNARNIGIQNAKGKYLAFIDADDDFEINMYQEMITKLEKEKNDLCICNYDEYMYKKNLKIVKSKYIYENIENSSNKILKMYLTDKISPAIWDKVYLTEFIKKINFNTQLSIGEDILFCLNIFLNTNKISFINKYYYHYYQNESSAMHNISDKMLEFSKVIDYIEPQDRERLKTECKEEFEYFECEMTTRGIHSIMANVCHENKKEATKYLKKYYDLEKFNKILNNKYFSKSIKIEIYILKKFGIKTHIILTPLYVKARNLSRK